MVRGARREELLSANIAIGIVERTSPTEYAQRSQPVRAETEWYLRRSSWNGMTGIIME
jgi:hypothetical protein